MSPSESRSDQTELEKILRSTKPWFAENGTTLIYALAAVLAVAAVIVFTQRQSSDDVQASGALLLANTPEQFGEVAGDFEQTTIGTWARLRQGEELLDNAVANMFTDRKAAVEELGQAKDAYEKLAERTDVDEQVRERVLIGLARIAETSCDGKPESTNAAVAAWQGVLDEFPESIVQKHAEERKEHLQSDESKTFYAWFSKLNPTPDDPGLAPGQPAVPEMPSFDDLMSPAGAGSTDGLPAEAESSDEIPASSEPAADAEKPEESEASTEPVQAEPDADTKPQAESLVIPSGEETPKADGDATPEPAAASDEATGKESAVPETAVPETPAENSTPATEGGDGNK